MTVHESQLGEEGGLGTEKKRETSISENRDVEREVA